MSVALGLFDERKNESILISYFPVASEAFYMRYWETAVKDMKIRLFKHYSSFSYNDIDEVLKELDLLELWTKKNLIGKDFNYMFERVMELKVIIPELYNNYKDKNSYRFFVF